MSSPKPPSDRPQGSSTKKTDSSASQHPGAVERGRKRAPQTARHAASAAAHAPVDEKTASNGNTQTQQMIERVGMINRIHSALRSTLNLEDIHTIILTTLVARSALDFSRGLLFGYDEARECFFGLAALGAPDRAANVLIQREIDEEERALADMVKDLRALQPTAEEKSFFNESLRELSSHSFWITTYQKYASADALNDAVRGIEIPYRAAPTASGAAAPADPPPCQFLAALLAEEHALVVDHKALSKSDLPPALIALLPQDSLWAVVKTQRGIRLLVVADRLFDDNPLSQTDLLHIDWFSGQVSLALENAEMFKTLETAFRELKDLDRMKSNFLATISHELRTPLTAITGFVQLMLRNKVGTITSGQQEVLERILAHSEMLTGKVNDLIEIAELDSGRALEIELEAVDPLNVLMNVLPRVEQRRANKFITIEPVVTHAIPLVRCVADGLGRILFHLIENAIKFGRTHGHVQIKFDTHDDQLYISVEDDGIGISKGQLQRIFDSFYQIDNQLTRHYEGLGIGLAIIKKQLDLTGGRIQVQSEPNQGSSFTIIYPLA